MLDHDIFGLRAAWLGGVQPQWSPAEPPVSSSCHADDTITVSLRGGAPEVVTLGHFLALVNDGMSDGSVHVGDLDGRVVTASFAQFRTYLHGRP